MTIFRHQVLDEHKPSSWSYRPRAVLRVSRALLVVPIINDVLGEIDVNLRDSREEISCHHATTGGKIAFGYIQPFSAACLRWQHLFRGNGQDLKTGRVLG